MNKEKLRRVIFYALIIFFGLALSITYFFILFKSDNVGSTLAFITSVLRPFIIGAVIAYVMKSTCNFYEKHIFHGLLKSGKRAVKPAKKTAGILSVILTYITWIIILGLLLWIVIPQFIESIVKLVKQLSENIPVYIETLRVKIESYFADNPQAQEYFDQIIEKAREIFNNWMDENLQPFLSELGNYAISGLVNFVVILKDTVIGIVLSAFFLAGRKVLAEKCKIFMHCIFKDKAANAIIDEFRFADKMFSGFLQGKVIDSAIIGILYYIAMVFMDVPYAPLVSVICGVTNIIPIFGPFIGSVPSAIIILTEDPIKVIYFIAFVCIMQFIDANIIDPHIVGGNIKMSSFCVLFAVIFFGGLWGFMGLLVGVPTFAVIYDIGKKLAFYLLRKKGKFHMVESFNEHYGNNKSNKNTSGDKNVKTKLKKDKKEKKKTKASENKDGEITPGINAENAENRKSDNTDSDGIDSDSSEINVGGSDKTEENPDNNTAETK